MGRDPMCTMGLGISSVSRMRNPCPPQNRTTFIAYLSAPIIVDLREMHLTFLITLLIKHLGFWDGHNETASPISNEGVLLDDFVLQVPRENKQVVGTSFSNAIRRKNRDVGPRKKLAVLVWIAIHRVIDKVRANSAVIQQCVSLARRSVSCDGLAFTPSANQEIQEHSLRLFYTLGEAAVALQLIHAFSGFRGSQTLQALGDLL